MPLLKSTGGGSGCPDVEPGVSARILRVEWLGQTAASVFWICSVLTYGINAMGDWLQLFAASAWLIANLATLRTVDPEPHDAASR